MTDWLITTDELDRLLRQEPAARRVVLDCSWYLPESGKQAIDDFRAGHIPGARFVDLTAISDPDSPYVNMLPKPEVFAEVVGRLGIDNETEVIVYDNGYVSARLWWMFRIFGHEKIRILDGGWRKWLAEQREIETGDVGQVSAHSFTARRGVGRVATADDVLKAITTGSAQVIDARTPTKFDGVESSGYPGVASGAMPDAVNVYWGHFFDEAHDFAFVTAERCAEIFADAGIDTSGPVITTCGSGVTASVLGFMLERLGNRDWRLYDGSWHEWGQLPDTPKVVKGPGREHG